MILSDYDSDDIAIGQVVVIVDDRLKKIDILFEHFGNIVEREEKSLIFSIRHAFVKRI